MRYSRVFTENKVQQRFGQPIVGQGAHLGA